MGKKRVHKKRKIIISLFLVLVLISVTVAMIYWKLYVGKTDENEISVGENQTLLTAQITEINGNEITYQEAEEVDQSQMKRPQQEKNTDSEEKSTSVDNQENNQEGAGVNNEETTDGNPDMSQGGIPGGNGDMPEGGMPGGNGDMPEGGMSGGNGDMPEGGMPGGNGDMPEGGMPGGNLDTTGSEKTGENGDSTDESLRQNKKTDTSDKTTKTMYILTGDAKTIQIPVGTTVVTPLGTNTTFSRLASGDMVKLLMEKNENGEDVIVGVWMIE